ncbi:MAG: alpha/beta fold hydrolase [Actinobacteria bacterium]|nr:alpha/beta fold hydrolase [Actinomycetota bacterium]
MAGITSERVEFASEGAILRGRLYRPSDPSDKSATAPVVVMTHGFSVLADWLTDLARDYAEAGFAVLVYDHRNFGRSEGEPRFGFDNLLQLRGYRDAIGFVAEQPGIDAKRICVFGQSASSLTAQFIGALDARVRAVICHTPVCGNRTTKFDETDEKFEWLRENWSSLNLAGYAPRELPVRFCRLHEGEGPVVVEGGKAVGYATNMRRKYSSDWSNQVFILQRKLPAQVNEQRLPARYLKVPTLFVVAKADEVPMCEMATNKRCFDLIDAAKEMLVVAEGHFDLADNDREPYHEALAGDLKFLRRVFAGN